MYSANSLQWLVITHLITIIRTLLLEPTTLVIVLTTGETNSMCSSKMATLERTRTCLERYENVQLCLCECERMQEALNAVGRRQAAGGTREKARGRRQEVGRMRHEGGGRKEEAGGRRQEARGKKQEGVGRGELEVKLHYCISF